MTDTTVAPAGGAPAAAPSEVVVDQNPVQVPPAVGAQAPDKPDVDVEGSKHRPPSRRETIKAAFDRAVKAQEEGARKPPANRIPEPRGAAEAKPGHNQPPEPTPQEKPQEKPQQHREGGRFARAPDQQQDKAPQDQPRQLPPHAPFAQPPARVSELARKDWADTPESVRGDIHRMHQEFGKAYKFYKDGHEAFQPIRRFHQMAQEHGTTLEKALTNYTSMEKKLREDPIAGLDVIINNLGLTTPDGQRLGLRDIAYHVLSSTPDQLRQIQQGNQQQAAVNQIGALHQEIAGLKSYLQQMHTQQQFTQTRSGIDQFADDGKHPRFDELGDLIEQELKLGFDLDTAYQRAELLRPATHAAQTRTTRAQTPDRSISGAPSGGPANGHDRSRPNGPPPSRRDAIQRAIKRVQGSL